MLPRVVITGMGVVSPNGMGKQEFCRAILAGKSGVKRIARFDPTELPVHIAGEIPDFDELAWVDARERKHVSRVVPLAVAASHEAIRDAGLDPPAMSMEEKREIGVILGTGGGAQEFSEEQYRLWHSGHVKQVSLFCIPSGTMGTIPSEVSMRFGFRGYSHVVTAGCTSSTDAIGYAYQHIQAGVQPMFLVGGVDSAITPGIIKGYTLLRALTQSWNHAPERASRPFSADRDGFVMAEGSWMFILEEYEHARARGAKVYAEISGYASTCEAFHRVRMSESPEEPARAITLALEEARLVPDLHHDVRVVQRILRHQQQFELLGQLLLGLAQGGNLLLRDGLELRVLLGILDDLLLARQLLLDLPVALEGRHDRAELRVLLHQRAVRLAVLGDRGVAQAGRDVGKALARAFKIVPHGSGAWWRA